MTIVEGVRVPVRRVGALIGPHGQVKAEIEARSGVRVDVESESGDVSFHDEKAFNPLLALKVREVVRAVGRGFSPDHAFRLFQDDTYLDVLDLQEYVGKQPKHVTRVRGRIIGSGGRTRRTIELSTGCDLAIDGDTVAILGGAEEVPLARSAVEMIIDGAPHSAVYSFLERKRRELRLHDLGVEF